MAEATAAPTVPIPASLRQHLDELAGSLLDAWNILEDAISDAERSLEVVEYFMDHDDGMTADDWAEKCLAVHNASGYQSVDDLLSLIYTRLDDSPVIAGPFSLEGRAAAETRVADLRACRGPHHPGGESELNRLRRENELLRQALGGISD